MRVTVAGGTWFISRAIAAALAAPGNAFRPASGWLPPRRIPGRCCCAEWWWSGELSDEIHVVPDLRYGD